MSEETVPSALKKQMDQLTETPAAPAAPAAPAPAAPAPVAPAADLTAGAKVLGKTGTPDSQPAPNEDWKHKYDVVNGMYRKDTAELREKNRQLEEELKKAREGGKPVQITAADISDDDVTALVDASLIDEFGIDYWKQQIAIQKTVAVNSAPQPAMDDSRIQNVEQQIANQNRQGFYSQLSMLVPNWEQINGTAEWNAFLGQIEPLTGATYEALLMDAYESFDAARTAQLFDKFLSAPNRAPGFDALATPAPQNGIVVPGAQGQTMTFEEWSAQMQALSSGGLSPMEVVQKQKELMAVWQEGRVTGAPQGSTPPM